MPQFDTDTLRELLEAAAPSLDSQPLTVQVVDQNTMNVYDITSAYLTQGKTVSLVVTFA